MSNYYIDDGVLSRIYLTLETFHEAGSLLATGHIYVDLRDGGSETPELAAPAVQGSAAPYTGPVNAVELARAVREYERRHQQRAELARGDAPQTTVE